MRFLLTTFCLLLTFGNAAAVKTIEVEKYTTEDGLSSNIIYRSLKDSKSFLWLATVDGLNRFDGKDFKIYLIPNQDATNCQLFTDSLLICELPFDVVIFRIYNPAERSAMSR